MDFENLVVPKLKNIEKINNNVESFYACIDHYAWQKTYFEEGLLN